ncbi:DNA-methyltransferase [Aliarcobacter butzleri]|uniref:DNA-methyltransferase n=1 Tax=Aliarcobacter butzleri TaxID=28197 RepID=UPI002B243036|nr:site-specific DNA-methyltransferase [Aliarcobacter butzleri]
MNKNVYQTIICETYNLDELSEQLLDFKKNISKSGNLFLITNNIYENNVIKNSFFDFIETALEEGFQYINTIVFPVENNSSNLKQNIKYLLWFVNDMNSMYFDKDTIREKHIWKDVEWGKRKKNYNEKGKDPSNIWIPTIDNGKGKITEHIILSREELLNRCIISTSQKNEYILIYSNKKINKNKLIKERNIELVLKNCIENNNTLQSGYLTKENNKFKGAEVYFSTSESMKEIESNTVGLMVTSPPYWDLKNYFKEGQIGQESYQEYIERLNKVWTETYRVLNNNGSMWININTRTKNKKPILIPNDIIKECKKIGFKLKDIIIWHKSSGIPTHKNNLVDKHEYFLWFIKSDEYFFNNDLVKEINYYKNDFLNNGLIWNINRKAGSVGKDFVHPAIYPTELIDIVIKLTTNENDVVMDPFLGSGTSMIASLRNNRNFIGYEFNEEFIDLIKFRVSQENIDEKDICYNFNKNVKKENSKIFRKDLDNE